MYLRSTVPDMRHRLASRCIIQSMINAFISDQMFYRNEVKFASMRGEQSKEFCDTVPKVMFMLIYS